MEVVKGATPSETKTQVNFSSFHKSNTKLVEKINESQHLSKNGFALTTSAFGVANTHKIPEKQPNIRVSTVLLNLDEGDKKEDEEAINNDWLSNIPKTGIE